MSTPLTDAINALTTYANGVTGAYDTTLSDAVATLAAGYGGGGGTGVLSGSYTPNSDSTSFSLDVGADFTNFLMYASPDPRGNSVKVFLACWIIFGSPTFAVTEMASNNSGTSFAGYVIDSNTSDQWFGKNGTTITCIKPGGSGANYPGYFRAGTTYNWIAW